MKKILLLLLLLVPVFVMAQFPDTPRKLRLGTQTDANYLIYVQSGAPAHTPADGNDTYMVLDTSNHVLYYYDVPNSEWDTLTAAASTTRDTVYQLTAVPDTITTSPLQGDIFVNSGKDTLGVYNGAAWVLFLGGADLSGYATQTALQDTSAAIRADFPAPDGFESTDLTSDTVYILLSGQSNAWGASGPTGLDTAGYEAVQIWNHADSSPGWKRAAINQRPFRSTGYNSLDGGNTRSDLNGSTNHTFYFAKKLHETTGKVVRIIMAIGDGRPINEWHNGTAPQKYLDSITVRSIAAGVDKYDFFVWNQGEADGALAENTYLLRLDSLRQTLLSYDWYDEQTFLFAVGLLREADGSDPTLEFWRKDTTLQKLDALFGTHVGYVSSENLAGNTAEANVVHFDSTSLREIGYVRMWETWKSLPRSQFNKERTGIWKPGDGIYSYSESRRLEIGAAPYSNGGPYALSVDGILGVTDGSSRNLYLTNGFYAMKRGGGINNVVIGPTTNNTYSNVQYGVQIGFSPSADYTTASNFVHIGRNAGDGITTGSNSVAIGFDAGKSQNGSNGIYIGAGAGNVSATGTATGQNNIGIGGSAFARMLTGDSNIGVGSLAGRDLSSGSNNTMVGVNTARSATDSITSGTVTLGAETFFQSSQLDTNIAIGFRAGYNNTFTNVAVIGQNAEATANNQILLGDATGGYTQLKSRNYAFNIDQSLVGLDGYVMTYNETSGEFEAQAATGNETITLTGDVTGSGTTSIATTIATGAVGPDELASTAVTPGSYTNANVTVDADGRVTAAANGTDNNGIYSGSDTIPTGIINARFDPTNTTFLLGDEQGANLGLGLADTVTTGFYINEFVTGESGVNVAWGNGRRGSLTISNPSVSISAVDERNSLRASVEVRQQIGGPARVLVTGDYARFNLTDSLIIDSLRTLTQPYLLGWNPTTKEVTAVDTTGLFGGGGTDDQTLSFTSPSLSIEGGNSVDLTALDTLNALSMGGNIDIGSGYISPDGTNTGIQFVSSAPYFNTTSFRVAQFTNDNGSGQDAIMYIVADDDRATIEMQANGGANAGDRLIFALRTDQQDVLYSVSDASESTFNEAWKYNYNTNLFTIPSGNLQVNNDIVMGSGGPLITSGSGSPESVVTAPVGSMYLRTDGGAGTTLYVKESGTGNTGWVGK